MPVLRAGARYYGHVLEGPREFCAPKEWYHCIGQKGLLKIYEFQKNSVEPFFYNCQI